MNRHDVIERIRKRAGLHVGDEAYQDAAKYIIKHILKLGRLIQYDTQYKGMILGVLEREYNSWEGATHHRTIYHDYHVARTKAYADLIGLIVTEWRD